jgi:hypothetical protein
VAKVPVETTVPEEFVKVYVAPFHPSPQESFILRITVFEVQGVTQVTAKLNGEVVLYP